MDLVITGLLLYLLCCKVNLPVRCDIVDQACISPQSVVLVEALQEGKLLILRMVTYTWGGTDGTSRMVELHCN